MKFAFGGQARVDKGKVVGNGDDVKNSSLKISSTVALCLGSLCNIFEMKFLAASVTNIP